MRFYPIEEVKSLESTNENSLEHLKEGHVFEYKPNNEEILKMASECLQIDQESDTHEEATKGLSTRLKANTPAVEKELTWDDVFKNYYFYKEESNRAQKTWLSLEGWLSANFNCPTYKI